MSLSLSFISSHMTHTRPKPIPRSTTSASRQPPACVPAPRQSRSTQQGVSVFYSYLPTIPFLCRCVHDALMPRRRSCYDMYDSCCSASVAQLSYNPFWVFQERRMHNAYPLAPEKTDDRANDSYVSNHRHHHIRNPYMEEFHMHYH